METLIRNAIMTPDGTVLESRHRHDYVTHVDAINGQEYMVDGGLDYVRRTLVDENRPAQDLCVYLEDGHEKVREALTWGTYGKNGDQPLRWVKLSEMSNAHIAACLETQTRTYPQVKTAFINELEYRAEHYIVVED